MAKMKRAICSPKLIKDKLGDESGGAKCLSPKIKPQNQERKAIFYISQIIPRLIKSYLSVGGGVTKERLRCANRFY